MKILYFTKQFGTDCMQVDFFNTFQRCDQLLITNLIKTDQLQRHEISNGVHVCVHVRVNVKLPSMSTNGFGPGGTSGAHTMTLDMVQPHLRATRLVASQLQLTISNSLMMGRSTLVVIKAMSPLSNSLYIM